MADSLEKLKSFFEQQVDIYGNELAFSRALRMRGQEQENECDENAWQKIHSLDELYSHIRECADCPLWKSRHNFVFGDGNPKADIVLVGEAPGADEDRLGKPFVGKAGELLDKILAAIQFNRNDVYVCNILKCRPPLNRDPSTDEIDHCYPYLEKQLNLINPQFILCLGRVAAQTLLKTREPLSQLRGKVHDMNGHRLIVTYHPAALLRDASRKRPTWEDVKLLRRLYDEWK